MPIAVLTFQFDPSTQLFGDLVVRWGTIALVVAIVATLILAGILARGGGLRADDVTFITIGIVPGAVIGGRLGYLILHAGTYGSAPEILLDPSVGGLELGLAVVGGFITGSYVASLLGSPVGRWLHIAVAPALFVLGVGKVTMVLTGTGQGLPNDGDWATRYLGPGPWGSLLPGLASDPSQAYEGIATLAILTAVTLLLMAGAFPRRDGKVFFVGIALWAVARAIVSTTWRDPIVTGRFNAGGLVAIGIASACVLALIVLVVRDRLTRGDPEVDPPLAVVPAAVVTPDVPAPVSTTTSIEPDLAWPDPKSRPRF